MLAVGHCVLTIFGFGWFQTAAGGYGGTKEKIIGFGVLAIAILLFLFRRIVQDGERPHWREDTPTMPDARQAALLEQAARPVAVGALARRRRGGTRRRPLAERQNRAHGRLDARTEFEIALGERDLRRPRRSAPRSTRRRPPEELELGDGLEGDPAIAFRRTLGMFATGVTVLTTRVGEQVHGMTANAFMSVSLRPPLVLDLGRPAREDVRACCTRATRFGVSVLEAKQTGLSDHFAGASRTSCAEPTFEIVHETPLVEGALAHLVARVVRSYWGGDHSLFLGQVEFARYGEGEPLLFHGGRYERLIERSASLLAAPTRACSTRSSRSARSVTYADGEPIMQIGEAGSELLLVARGRGAGRAARPDR